MSHLNPPSHTDGQPLRFIEQNPALCKIVGADSDSELSRVATLVDPLLNIADRCEISVYYIQAVTTGKSAFLTTNLHYSRSTHVTEVATSWLIGRSESCAICIPYPSISRCHAVIGHCATRGFYIMDVGSSNGTFVNRRRLAAQEQRFLNDGDLIEFSHVRLEFFLSGWQDAPVKEQETLA